MSESNITKLALASSLKELMSKKDFSKISVRNIVENCGVTRQAFYYHFQDKYDLMNWIYYTETARFVTQYGSVENWTNGIRDLCLYMQKNKTFYINALNTVGQNSFQEYLFHYIRDLLVSVIEKIKNTECLEKKWDFFAEFTATAFVGLIRRWANSGMQEDPAEFIAEIRKIFDGSILRELEDDEKQNEKSRKGEAPEKERS